MSHKRTHGQRALFGLIGILGAFCTCFSGVLLITTVCWPSTAPQTANPLPKSLEADFGAIVASMANAAPDDNAAIKKSLEKAAGILDSAVLGALPEHDATGLDQINARLTKFISHESGMGESYRLVSLGGQPRTYALVADFGLGAPSAIRIYSQQGSAKRYSLAAKIDRFTQDDFLDDSLELVPISATPIVFVTVAGRTDDLRTGIFTAWQFDGKGLKQIWASDLLQQSDYQVAADGFQLTYCHDPDETDPNVCKGMVREKYSFQGGAWVRTESTKIPVPK